MKKIIFIILMFMSFVGASQNTIVLLDTTKRESHLIYFWDGICNISIADSNGFVSKNRSFVNTSIYKLRIIDSDSLLRTERYEIPLIEVAMNFTVSSNPWEVVNTTKLKNKVLREIKKTSLNRKLNKE